MRRSTALTRPPRSHTPGGRGEEGKARWSVNTAGTAGPRRGHGHARDAGAEAACSLARHVGHPQGSRCTRVHTCTYVYIRVHTCTFVYIRVHSCTYVYIYSEDQAQRCGSRLTGRAVGVVAQRQVRQAGLHRQQAGQQQHQLRAHAARGGAGRGGASAVGGGQQAGRQHTQLLLKCRARGCGCDSQDR